MSRQRSVRVGLIGVGNCASSLVQGVEFYRHFGRGDDVPGLMHYSLGGYRPSDIEFSAAFDIAGSKVGLDLSEAIFAHPNNTVSFSGVQRLGVPVRRGPTLDGLGRYLNGVVEESPEPSEDVCEVLRETGTEVVVLFLPVGSQHAAEWYARQALGAGCALVNCIPVFIASRHEWRARFEAAGLPIIGDDVKPQLGATITHRMLTNLFRDRGVRLDRTYQLGFGGNTDSLNMLERDRLESKTASKTESVKSQLNGSIQPQNIHVGPGDYVPWLTDRKVCYIRMEGTGFGNVPLNCELRMEVWESPNCAGVVVDAVRCAKLALDRRIGGALGAACSYLMKSPPQQLPDHAARELLEEYIRGGSGIAGTNGHAEVPLAAGVPSALGPAVLNPN